MNTKTEQEIKNNGPPEPQDNNEYKREKMKWMKESRIETEGIQEIKAFYATLSPPEEGAHSRS